MENSKMQHFQELQQAIAHRCKVEEYIKRIKSLGYIGNFSKKEFIGIVENSNGRYTFDGIADIIGAEKLNSIICQFEGLINVELHKAKEKADKELSRYSINKTEDAKD